MNLQEPLWTSAEAAIALDIVGGRPWYADGLQVDSRSVHPGDLFVAMPGTESDGHDFVAQAISRGAVAAIVAQDFDAPVELEPKLVRVQSPAKALRTLAHTARDRAPATFIGVTGSVGKTSVVHALRHVLEQSGPTHSSIKSYNNHVGVPLSLGRMPRSARFGVLEMGMNHAGEMLDLSSIVRPDIAIITTVGPAHIENFDSVADIAKAKAEILEHVTPHGIAIIGIDHEHSDDLIKVAREKQLQIVTVSAKSRHADVCVASLSRQVSSSCVTATVCGVPVTYRIGIAGDAWVLNSLLILAACHAVGVDLGSSALAMASLEAEVGRGRIHTLRLKGGEVTLIDDSYNASPMSVQEAFKRLALAPRAEQSKRYALLADMRELGFTARDQHVGLATALRAAEIDKVYAYGSHMVALAEAAGVDYEALETLDRVALRFARSLGQGDVLLVKGANAAGLSRVVEELNKVVVEKSLSRHSA